MPNTFTQASYSGSEKITECKNFEVFTPGGNLVGTYGVYIIDTPNKDQFVVVRNQVAGSNPTATLHLVDLERQLRTDAKSIVKDAHYFVAYPPGLSASDELIHALSYQDFVFSENDATWYTPTGMSTILGKKGLDVSVAALSFF